MKMKQATKLMLSFFLRKQARIPSKWAVWVSLKEYFTNDISIWNDDLKAMYYHTLYLKQYYINNGLTSNILNIIVARGLSGSLIQVFPPIMLSCFTSC